MKVIYGLRNVKKFKKPVIALGVFDGVHLGHCNILKGAACKARAIRGTSIALTFDPHPQKEESLTSLAHRLRLIAAQGIRVCIVINFNRHFKDIGANEFVKNILVKKLGAYYVFVGDNFRYGKKAAGDVTALQQSAKMYHFKVKVFRFIRSNYHPVSSTYIRNLIKQGKLAAAQKLLCRPVTVLGSVIRGTKVGRRLGFPTANIDPHHEVIPPKGVYAAMITLGKRKFPGICNIGTRPTVMKAGKVHIEVNIFDFHENIYGKYLEIEFLKKIRNEKKFSSTAALIDQIRNDITFAKDLCPRTRSSATPH